MSITPTPQGSHPNRVGSLSTTQYDERIARLEARREELETQRQRLLRYQMTVQGPDGSNTIEVDLGAQAGAEAGADPATIERKIRQMLEANPLFRVMASAAMRKEELREELVATGEWPAHHRHGGDQDGATGGTPLTSRLRGGSPLRKAMLANARFNRAIGHKTHSRKLAHLAGSGWLALLGLIFLLWWGGGPLVFALSGGAIAGITPRPTTPSRTTTATATTTIAAPKTTAASSSSQIYITHLAQGQQPRQEGVLLASYRQPQLQLVTTTPTVGVTPTPLVTVAVMTTALATTTATTPAAPTSQAEPDAADPNSNSSYGRVGQPPSSAGGLNGPHGAFAPPDRMQVAALELDVAVQRAITEESGPADAGSTTGTFRGAVRVTWPRPAEVAHLGAYPGEQGNLIVMGNQAQLASLRRLQVSDEILLLDRKGNRFIYRVLPFSPNGQPERVVDPLRDNWVFLPTQEALLTIVVTPPQPQPPLQVAVPGNSRANRPTLDAEPQDDYLASYKLAYRAVLAVYAPVRRSATPTGTPVAVPESVWTTRPAAVITPPAAPAPPTPASPPTSSPPVPTPTTRPTVVIPSGLPNTGMGGSLAPTTPTPTNQSESENHKERERN